MSADLLHLKKTVVVQSLNRAPQTQNGLGRGSMGMVQVERGKRLN